MILQQKERLTAAGKVLPSPTLHHSQGILPEVQILPTCCVPADISHLLSFRSHPCPLVQPHGLLVGPGKTPHLERVFWFLYLASPLPRVLSPNTNTDTGAPSGHSGPSLEGNALPHPTLSCAGLTLFLLHIVLGLFLFSPVGLPQQGVNPICAVPYLTPPSVPPEPSSVPHPHCRFSVNEWMDGRMDRLTVLFRMDGMVAVLPQGAN